MAMKRMTFAFAVFALSLSLPASAASERTLAETLAFIRDQVVAQGEVSYVVAMHDPADNSNWKLTMTSAATKVVADATRCRIDLHWKTTLDGEVKQDQDEWIDFASGRKVSVVSREQEIRTQVKASGNPDWVARVSPSVWVVTVYQTSVSHVLNFTDESTAERVVRAVDHAMDLCGAKKEGF
jgi:hypothetical protein